MNRISKLLILLLLISTVTFSKVQCKYSYGCIPRRINKVLSDLQSKGYKIIDIKFTQHFGTTDECIIFYEDNQ